MDRCRFISFINQEGGAMFKIYVGTNKDHTLKADQVARFEALREACRERA